MAEMFCFTTMTIDGEPEFGGLPLQGYVLGGNFFHDWGAYLVMGTDQQINDISALPNVIEVVRITETETTYRLELDGTPKANMFTKINNWLTAQGFNPVESDLTYGQILKQVITQMNSTFDLELIRT